MGHPQDPSSAQDPTRVTPFSEHGSEGPLFFRASLDSVLLGSHGASPPKSLGRRIPQVQILTKQ
jgi:hypothetical protein